MLASIAAIKTYGQNVHAETLQVQAEIEGRMEPEGLTQLGDVRRSGPDLSVLFSIHTLLVALAVTVVAVVGKDAGAIDLSDSSQIDAKADYLLVLLEKKKGERETDDFDPVLFLTDLEGSYYSRDDAFARPHSVSEEKRERGYA